MKEAIAKYFEFSKHNTNFRIEFVAGLSTFLSLSYIFVVNPSILSKGGLNANMVLFATIITSFLATFFMGIWAKKPFALAPVRAPVKLTTSGRSKVTTCFAGEDLLVQVC